MDAQALRGEGVNAPEGVLVPAHVSTSPVEPGAMADERWRGGVLVGDDRKEERLCAVTLGRASDSWPRAWVWYPGFGWSLQDEDNFVDQADILVAWARSAQARAEKAELDGKDDRDARQAYRAKWVAVLEALGLEAGDFDAVGAIGRIKNSLGLAESLERLSQGVLREVLASAVPHPTEHPTMHAAWQKAHAYLRAASGQGRAWAALPAPQRHRVAIWLEDTMRGMEVEREQMATEHGFDFVAAVEALVAWVTP